MLDEHKMLLACLFVSNALKYGEILNGELNQPSEEGFTKIARAAGSFTFPARFMLVAAMNPCKCGYYGDPKRDCRCTSREIENYRRRISGPLLDRIDLHVEVPAVTFQELQGRDDGSESSATIRARVESARDIQRERYGASTTTTNASMSSRQLKQHCQLDAEGRNFEHAMNELHLSARAHDRILKVARTLADLGGSENIRADDILEAIQYRSLDRKVCS